jgi:ADP-ribose pyrophosphatase
MNPKICKVKSEVVYRGKVVDLTLDTYRADGHTFLRETIQHPSSVVILPILPDGKVLLLRQFRHAVGRFIYEIPAGTKEEGETLLACAKRELAEETGHTASFWKRLCQFYPAPGISTERMVLYLAKGLKPLKRKVAMDKDEYIAHHPATVKEVLDLVRTHRVVDAKSIIGILWGLGRIRW